MTYSAKAFIAISILLLAAIACSAVVRPASPSTQVVVIPPPVTASDTPVIPTASPAPTRVPPGATATEVKESLPDISATDTPRPPAATNTLLPASTKTHTPLVATKTATRSSVTATRTFTPTATVVRLTATASNTPTHTISPTATATRASATPSSTPTRTFTPTTAATRASATPTKTFTPTQTPTPAAESPTPTRTFTPTPTSTIAPASATPTRTFTPTNTAAAPTATFTFTPTTIQPTSTVTFTPTVPPPTFTPMPPINTPAGCQPQGNGGFESQVIALINVERANNGLGPLSEQSQLAAAARVHSNDMACNHFFSHTGSDGSSPFERMSRQGYSFSAAAENIAAGYGSPADVVAGWMGSEGHRANILGTYVHIGVGYTYEPNSDWGTYWTVTFGTP